MITRSITNFRPHIKLFVKGSGGQGYAEFTVDTGYTGTLTLPPAECTALQLTLGRRRRTFLADGSEVNLAVYFLTVVWDGEEREVEILAIESEPLLGVTMLQGYKACFDFSANTLTIEAA